jgi:uncharacterized protein YidB (DUF937 family)
MGLLETVLGGLTGKSNTTVASDPLLGALSSLLTQNGGLQGLMEKFSHAGLGEVFSSWVGMGQNRAVSPAQIQNVLGSEQVRMLAGKLGMDSGATSEFLADHLPKIVDKLTPAGAIDPGDDHHQGLADMLPALLQSLAAEGRAA